MATTKAAQSACCLINVVEAEAGNGSVRRADTTVLKGKMPKSKYYSSKDIG